jgi:N,N-dimethylformamidase
MDDWRPSGRTLAGYRDRLSARPGETVRFNVSSFDGLPFVADLVRIRSGNTLAGYAGLELDEVAAPFAGEHVGVNQIVQCGSCGVVDEDRVLVEAGGAFSIACAVQPGTHGRGSVALFALSDVESGSQAVLGIKPAGHLCFRRLASDGSLVSESCLSRALPLRRWSVVGVSLDPRTRELRLFQRPRAQGSSDPTPVASEELVVEDTQRYGGLARATFGARWNPGEGGLRTLEHLNGRLDSPRLLTEARGVEALVACVEAVAPPAEDAAVAGWWDFAQDMGGATFGDRSRNGRQGHFRNLPTRAVCGLRWTGRESCWRHAPNEYSAVHFHEYDLYDAEWDESFSYTVPATLSSGVYAARVRKGSEVDYLVFYVLPPRDADKADVVFLASTATYLAYANETLALVIDQLFGANPPLQPEERLLLERPEYGPSLYNSHVDGSGVHFSSYLRPTLNWRPGGRVWCLNADFDVTRWLDSELKNDAYDVITDEALDLEGEELLDGHRVVVTGTHPEYWSERMRAALEEFLAGGGRLMYMGGNGFYWKVASSRAWPAAVELRRAEDGTRAWMSRPCEYHHQFDGQLGGLWQRSGKAPQQLVGVGFAAQGMPGALRFRRAAGAEDPRASFALHGIHEEVLCDFKRMKATCNGEEVDRVDAMLGTPEHTLVLARSERSRADLIRTKEELLTGLPWLPDPEIRADVVFFETPGGGAVFSTGSIGWSSVLAWNDYENPAARLSANVLYRFCDPEPFAMPDVDNTALDSEGPDPLPGLGISRLGWREIASGALHRAVQLLGLSVIAKIRGLEAPPPPAQHRDRLDPQDLPPVHADEACAAGLATSVVNSNPGSKRRR